MPSLPATTSRPVARRRAVVGRDVVDHGIAEDAQPSSASSRSGTTALISVGSSRADCLTRCWPGAHRRRPSSGRTTGSTDLSSSAAGSLHSATVPLVFLAILAPRLDPGVVHLHLGQDHVAHQLVWRNLLQGQCGQTQNTVFGWTSSSREVHQRGDRRWADLLEASSSIRRGSARCRRAAPARARSAGRRRRRLRPRKPAIQYQPGDQLVVGLDGNRVSHIVVPVKGTRRLVMYS